MNKAKSLVLVIIILLIFYLFFTSRNKNTYAQNTSYIGVTVTAQTPTPFIRMRASNPQLTPVPVANLCKVNCGPTPCTNISCKSNVSLFDSAAAPTSRGGRFNDPNLILLGVTPKVNGNPTTTGIKSANCKGQGGVCYYWSSALSTGYRTVWFIVATPTPTATLTPTPTPTSSPTPTPNPTCGCKSDNTCDSSCAFDKYSDVTYANPIKCLRETALVGPTPDTNNEQSFCTRVTRTKGDVDGDGVVTNLDYYYYVAAVNGGGIPAHVDPDVNGDGLVSPADRTIIVRTLSVQ